MNFTMDKPFTVTAAYAEGAELPSGCSSDIGTFKVRYVIVQRHACTCVGENRSPSERCRADRMT